ncbi:ubiquitin carboxyl-terminal hydrolase 37-like isoform X4 [Brienomyrus brachyistius]|uniref:ubiquitin carboxyl-terminal hydrolase 37-like isoform X3 n=1 Tax=Brienomyrus brachyistius TaxID=42636 RepID=UPI0020B21788|nr:ubiquitin carboxyl-terminal hydrolase 37-like isoform X3 [Brienomyrus brachyistius]XP_048869903.1 ubiquitin carboxyl-terminal hydrolase 37-like isoform X4 [Brienomyrus brachyistius]
MSAHRVLSMSCLFFCWWPRKKQHDIGAAEEAEVNRVTTTRPQKRRLKFRRKFPWLKLAKSRAKESSDEDTRSSGDCKDSGSSNAFASTQSRNLTIVDSESLTSDASSTGSSVEEHPSPPEVTRDIPPNEGPGMWPRRFPIWPAPFFMGDRGDAAEGQKPRLVCLGLPNLGQTCYMNATLQCLFHLPSFCEDISRQEEYWRLVPSADLLRCFTDLASTHGSSGKQKTLLKHLLPKVSCHFDEDEQNDAHEFFSCLMSRISELGNLIQARMRTTTYTCPVGGNMGFQMLCQRTCASCGGQSTRTEDFNHLSLDVIPLIPVKDLLENYFKDTEVELTCATCSGSEAVLSWTFLTLPRVLVLHLKRFSYTPQYQLKKVQDPVLLCREITLLPHFREISPVTERPQSAGPEEPHLKDAETTQEAHASVEDLPGDVPRMPGSGDAGLVEEESHTSCRNLPTVDSPPPADEPETGTEQHTPALLRVGTVGGSQGEPAVSETPRAQPARHRYQLAGVLSHLGSSATSGHYISDNFSRSEKGWLSFSDLTVKRLDEGHVLRKRQSSAYMLFYTQQVQKDTEETPKRHRRDTEETPRRLRDTHVLRMKLDRMSASTGS